MLALRHPLQWDGGDGGTMAKKDAADYLARLPQFEPRPIPFADLQEYDIQVQREQGIDVETDCGDVPSSDCGEAGLPRARKQRIDDVLSKFMAPYTRDARKLEPFLK